VRAGRQVGRRAPPLASIPRGSERTVSTETDSAESLVARVNRLDLLERVADDLAHEIKNPLHSMVINLEVLKRRAARCSPEESEPLLRYAEVIGTELDRLSRRVELLLRFTRPMRRAENASPAELVEELLELIRVQAARRDVQLRYEPDGCAAWAHIARDPFQQIILNLAHEVLSVLGRGDAIELHLECGEDGGRVVLTARSANAIASELQTRLADAAAMHDERPLAVARTLAAAAGARIEVVARGRAEPARAGAEGLDIVLHLPTSPR
jgi:signal transduction histidine kinase